MPNTSSAQKALRQTVKRTHANKTVKHAMTVATKTVRKSAAAGAAEAARKELIAAQKLIAKAAQKKVIKKNTASRRIARLSKLIAKIK